MRGHLLRAHAGGMLRHPARVRRARPRAAVAQWLMLLVALAGLMAMHGLSDHGVGGGPVAMSSAMSSMTRDAGHPQPDMPSGTGSLYVASAASSATTAHAGHVAGHLQGHVGLGKHSATTGSSSVVTQNDAGGTDGGGHGDHDGMLAGMCLAVMTAVLALGVAACRTRLLAHLRDVFGDLHRVALTTWRARSRGPAPPDLRLLSIQRC